MRQEGTPRSQTRTRSLVPLTEAIANSAIANERAAECARKSTLTLPKSSRAGNLAWGGGALEGMMGSVD